MPSKPVTAIAIIGGGISGCLVAAQLLRQARAPLQVLLFERMTDIGRGVAYGTEHRVHLLNVPAGRMGAFPDDLGHFQRWVAAKRDDPDFPAKVAAEDYLPRWMFGDYVRSVLAEARTGARPGVELIEVKGDVIDLETEGEGGGVRVRCGDGRGFDAHRVVLALGNLPGEYPIRRTLPIYHSPGYVHVPWRPGALAGIPPEADVLLVGAGLTAVDIALQLQLAGHTGTVHALSRRGLRPQAHQPAALYPAFLADEKLPTTMLGIFRRVRAELKRAQAAGIDWRPVLDAIRPQTPALWAGLSWDERARFMRHVRPFWEGHRHRLAPFVAEKIERMRAVGRLHFYAGRLESLVEKDGGVEARFRERGTTRKHTLQVIKVINCTGPRSDYSKYQHPLLINLLARSLIDHDPLALGINATPEGEVLSYRGGPVGWLYTLGAPLKGVLWECTAVPEIRNQAQALALRLLATRP